MALIGGLLLYLVPAHAQQDDSPASIPAGQAAKLLMSSRPPLYPAKAKASGIEGTVVVYAQINKHGRVDFARVVSGPEALRQAALDDVKYCVYRPYVIDGSAAGFRTTIKVNFVIEKSRVQSSPNN